MSDIKKMIKEVRPKLKVVSPLAAAIMFGYGVINLFLGIGLFFYVNPSPDSEFAVITPYTPFEVWGVIFFLIGLFKLFTYYRNDWVNMRRSLILGVLIKSIWFFALFIRWLDGSSIILLVVWGFFMYVQIVTFRHFIPNVKQRLI